MTSPADIAREYTGLELGARQHLERLMGSWSLLADLSFADLLLYVPLDQFSLAVAEPAPGEERHRPRPRRYDPPTGPNPIVRGLHFVVLGQMRPTNAQTLFELDLVGQVVAAGELPLVLDAWRSGTIMTGARPLSEDGAGGVVRYQCIPVRWQGEVIGVLTRVWSPTVGRRTGGLERVYTRLFERFAAMVTAGDYPFLADDAEIEEAPRVGDGVIVLDPDQRISFASPNATNALHRMGIVSAIVGATLEELGVDSEAVRLSFSGGRPVVEEMERRPDVIVLVRAIPLIEDGAVSGAAVLVRDVTDLRRRDRLLLSKDAAIREVHHRVKNNLQTISSLLRLQARRVGDPAARVPLLEAERRIRAIALVHEILARDPGEQIPFDEIVPALVQLARDANVARPSLEIRTFGDAGELVADVATPLAVVIAELLQNAAEHGFAHDAPEGPPPLVELDFTAVGAGTPEHALEVTVRDNGRGFPEGFDIDATGSLGLAIVRDLVRSQLGGTIEVGSDRGAVVRLRIPLARPADRSRWVP